jgi:hypothetical protein
MVNRGLGRQISQVVFRRVHVARLQVLCVALFKPEEPLMLCAWSGSRHVCMTAAWPQLRECVHGPLASTPVTTTATGNAAGGV